MRNQIACFVFLCEVVFICKGFYNNKDEKCIATLDFAYVQNIPKNLEDRYLCPDLFVSLQSPNTYVLYDAFVTANGREGGVKIVKFQILDVSMLVDKRIVLITNVPGTILHCQFSSSSSVQTFYKTLRATLPAKFFFTYSFNLVKVSKIINDDGSLVVISGDSVVMKIHSLEKVDGVTMLRFVVELNGRDEPPLLVFTSTNSGVTDINYETNEMALEIWNGLFTKDDVYGFIVKFNALEARIFTSMFSRKFDELLSSLSRRYITKMDPSSSGSR